MLPSGLLEEIDDDEDLARFLVQSSHFSTTSVKPSAFLPSPKDGETSVSRHGRETYVPPDRLFGCDILEAASAPDALAHDA
jgi:hypothetical protein